VSRERFEARHQASWAALAEALGGGDAEPARVVDLYRAVCQHLALARHRQYGVDLVSRLNDLALRGHEAIYGARVSPWGPILAYAAGGYAREVRARWRTVLGATVLFYGPFLLLIGLIQVWPDLVHAALPAEMIGQLEQMYDPAAEAVVDPRVHTDQRAMMFGFYVWNNVGIALRTFATGLFFGLGSIFFLAYNGVVLGAAAGHLTRIGSGWVFWPFVIGHGALELTAIVLAGATGLELGAALVQPGRRTRARALREEARGAAGRVAGFSALLVLAAAVEAFWSPSPEVSPQVKLGVGAALWGLVGLYFLGAGRGS